MGSECEALIVEVLHHALGIYRLSPTSTERYSTINAASAAKLDCISYLIGMFADRLQEKNPAFNRALFLQAIHWEPI